MVPFGIDGEKIISIPFCIDGKKVVSIVWVFYNWGLNDIGI